MCTEPARRGVAGWSVVIDVGDGFADRAFIQGGLLVNQSCHQRGVAELVNAARQALGVLEDAGHGIVGEERTWCDQDDIRLFAGA